MFSGSFEKIKRKPKKWDEAPEKSKKRKRGKSEDKYYNDR